MRAPEIYTGFWTDYSRDKTTRLILTLSASNGALLIAFLALFVTLVGARSWIITTFVLYSFRAKDGAGDGLHHQSQFLLRNAGSELPLATELSKLGFAWRKTGVSATRRTLPITVAACIHFALFTAAGLFSSRIALNQLGPNRALLKPYHCGAIIGNTKGAHRTGEIAAYYANEARTALNYVDTCYNGEIGSADCDIYPTSKLEFSTIKNATCPFKPDWRCCQPLEREQCQSKNGDGGYDTQRAIQFDTGKIDMLDLGYNVPAKQRLLYRKVTTCSPLSIDTSEVAAGDKSDTPEFFFELGPYAGMPYTYSFDSHAALDGFGYQLEAVHSGRTRKTPGSFYPIANLRRDDANVVLIFITSNAMAYLESVDDRVFGAHKKVNVSSASLSFDTVYIADTPVAVIGCADQHQMCDANDPGKCTPLTLREYLPHYLDKIGVRSDQLFISGTIIEYGMDEVPGTLGPGSLKAQDRTYAADFSAALPANQWEIEASRWFAATLAALQRSLVSYANKYDGDVPDMVPAGRDGGGDRAVEQCYRQVIRVSGSYQSFSVLGLALTLALGLLIVLISMLIEPFAAYLQRVSGKGRVTRLQHVGDSLLQTHRSALEDSERGRWRPGSFGIPITIKPTATFPHLFQDSPTKHEESSSDENNVGVVEKTKTGNAK